jgi:hypothetical protein
VNVRKWRWLAVQFVLGAVVLAACGAIVARTVSRSGASAPAENTGKPVSLSLQGRTAATLQVLSGTPALTIRMAALGPAGKLIQVSMTSSNAAARLKLTDGGAQPSGLVNLSATDADALTVTLNSAVRWTLTLAGGSTRTIADLSGGQVAGIAFTRNGSGTITLTLAKPAGSVPIRLAAGATQLQLSVPGGVPVRVTAAAGAGEISLEGQTHKSVKKGTVLTTRGWSASAAGFDVDAVAGAAKLTVTTRSS